MPCFYTGTAEGDRSLAAQERFDSEREAHNKDTKTLTQVTQMLCGICNKVENILQREDYPEEYDIIDCIDGVSGLRKWWEKHKEIDKKRIERERQALIQKKLESEKAERRKLLIKSASEKLTKEEREELGI